MDALAGIFTALWFTASEVHSVCRRLFHLFLGLSVIIHQWECCSWLSMPFHVSTRDDDDEPPK